MKEFPFKEVGSDGKLIRTFDADVLDEELVWHRDREDRLVKVVEVDGWGFQRDNELPLPLHEGQEIYIPKMSWHRVIKGQGKLVVEIYENTSKK
tara:strand:- start:1681 stop:1962 length:282 start_codon:yes stop_codon:yes gene_type:complete